MSLLPAGSVPKAGTVAGRRGGLQAVGLKSHELLPLPYAARVASARQWHPGSSCRPVTAAGQDALAVRAESHSGCLAASRWGSPQALTRGDVPDLCPIRA